MQDIQKERERERDTEQAIVLACKIKTLSPSLQQVVQQNTHKDKKTL